MRIIAHPNRDTASCGSFFTPAAAPIAADVAWFPATEPANPDDADYVSIGAGWASQTIAATDARDLVAAGARRVAVLPDREANAEARAAAIVRACRAAGLDARIVRLPALGPGESFVDFIDQRGDAELLQHVCSAWPLSERLDRIEAEIETLRRELRQSAEGR